MGATAVVEPVECARCGLVHERCSAHTGAGKPCRKWPVSGASVCGTHGGSAPQVKAKAEKRVVRARQEALARRWNLEDVPVDEHPVEGLLREYRRTAAVVAMLDELIACGPAGADVYVDKTDVARVSPYIEWWERERDRLAKRSVELLRAGVEERAIKLEEGKQRQVVQLLTVALDAAGVSGEARAVAARAMIDAYRALPE